MIITHVCGIGDEHAVWINTYFERYCEEGDEYVGKRQVSQIVVGDRPHTLTGGYGPYYQTVPGYGDHGYWPVEHGQYDH